VVQLRGEHLEELKRVVSDVVDAAALYSANKDSGIDIESLAEYVMDTLDGIFEGLGLHTLRSPSFMSRVREIVYRELSNFAASGYKDAGHRSREVEHLLSRISRAISEATSPARLKV